MAPPVALFPPRPALGFANEGLEQAGKNYVVSYQNVKDNEPTNEVAQVIRHTLQAYE
jgi:hypothetical protein